MTPIRMQHNKKVFEKKMGKGWESFEPNPDEQFFLTLLTRYSSKKGDGFKYLNQVQLTKFYAYDKFNHWLNRSQKI